MSARANTGTDADHGVREFGYDQKLDRSIGRFASFAAGVSYISILTGVFGLFYVGYGAGGPAYFWSWPMVFVGQLMVALCFAELASRYPVAGSLYNWAKKLTGPHTSWLAGWLLIVSSIVTVGAVAVTIQVTLPQIWSVFQFIGDGTGAHDASLNGVILAGALVAFTTLVNAFGVRLTTIINSIGVFVELLAAVGLVVVLAINAVRGPSVLVDTQQHGQGQPLGYFGAFLVAALASGFVMFGFDTASSLGEETKDPKRTAPRAIIRAVTASFLLGGALLFFGLLAARSLADPKLASSEGGLQYIVLSVLGGGLGKVFLVCVAIAILVCALAIQAAAVRMVFAMARDNNLPFARWLAQVHPVRKTPTNAAVTTGVIALAILAVMMTQPQISVVLSTLAIVLIYSAYLLVTVPMLVSRLRGRWPLADRRPGEYSIGRVAGLVVNVLAVVWGAAMALNMVWPRAEVYNPEPPHHWYLRWAGVLVLGVLVVGGWLLFHFRLRHRAGVLPGHAADPSAPRPAESIVESPS
ncbi:APC family permease [Sciscionella sediminilitoris]|uniref:APC family permease n=1 Tax=Sciscionella sediminilitoris TaxID=1445613 RepID=UPI0004DEE77D|nr:APC family permease [Sciscionella sp. SE31]